jgi:cell wall-associated NlpC family hydrolase
MPKIRRGNFVFLGWVGDHSPRHVHVYCKGKLVVKWDLENDAAMAGTPTRRILRLIRELKAEGLL